MTSTIRTPAPLADLYQRCGTRTFSSTRDGADVVVDDVRVERTRVNLRQEQRERAGRDAPPPVLAPDPVTDERVSGPLPAQHVPHDLAVEQDRPFAPGVVAQDVRRPVMHERFSVPRRERRHSVRDGICSNSKKTGRSASVTPRSVRVPCVAMQARRTSGRGTLGRLGP